jgi:inorganic pyrophosphatase
VYVAISDGAETFLHAEYKICAVFVVTFALVIFLLISLGQSVKDGVFTMVAFVTGALTSMISGYIGMRVAVFANARTAKAAAENKGSEQYTRAFNMAFRAGNTMGFCLCSLGILILWVLLQVYKNFFDVDTYDIMMDCISGYGLGGSSIAMFGRVGGGIYTKAADVGADLVGKCDLGIPEDDPRNPATIADNVGDNVGDVAGMSADLFGSFAESTCACLVIAASSASMRDEGWNALLFPVSARARSGSATAEASLSRVCCRCASPPLASSCAWSRPSSPLTFSPSAARKTSSTLSRCSSWSPPSSSWLLPSASPTACSRPSSS